MAATASTRTACHTGERPVPTSTTSAPPHNPAANSRRPDPTHLVPATMALLGDRNWYLPRWLERRFPNVHFSH